MRPTIVPEASVASGFIANGSGIPHGARRAGPVLSAPVPAGSPASPSPSPTAAGYPIRSRTRTPDDL
jgi:hypothetical protein